MGLLDEFGPVTANQGMLAQALRSRNKPPMQLKPNTPQGLLDNAALATSPVPILGDLMGLGADGYRFATDPSSRTPANFGLAALGLLPFVPSLARMAYESKAGARAMADTPFNNATRRQGGAVNPKDYQGLHTPPMKDSGAPLHDLTGGGKVYPDDVYGPNGLRYYGSGDDALDREAYSIAMAAKDRPDMPVKMYRAVPYEATVAEQIAELEKGKAQVLRRGIMPNSAQGQFKNSSEWYEWAGKEIDRLKSLPETPIEKLGINHGDWVTTSRNYAKGHGEGALQGKYKILSKTVPARKLYTNGDSWAEYGYDQTGKINPALLPVLGGVGLLGMGFTTRSRETE